MRTKQKPSNAPAITINGVNTQCVVLSVIAFLAFVVMPLLYHIMPSDGLPSSSSPIIPIAMSQEEHNRLVTKVDQHEARIKQLEEVVTQELNLINGLASDQTSIADPISNPDPDTKSNTPSNKEPNIEPDTSNLNGNTKEKETEKLGDNLVLKETNGKQITYDKDGVIYGNPLNLDVCRNALLSDHEVPVLTDLSKEQGTIPNFWSRESIGAALQNLAWSQETMSLSSDSSLYIDTQNNDLTQYKQSKTIKPNEELKTKCGITFVENPIIRFVTEYYAINALIFQSASSNSDKFKTFINSNFSFWNTKGEPQRFRAFVDDMSRYHYRFMKSHSALSHLSSQAGLLGMAQIDTINFIGRLSKKVEHLAMLHKHCPSSVDLSQLSQLLTTIDSGKMDNNIFGVAKDDSLTIDYRSMMSLPDDGIPDLLPAFNAMNYDTWHKIVDYFWQDFVCFDYKADYSVVQKIVDGDQS